MAAALSSKSTNKHSALLATKTDKVIAGLVVLFLSLCVLAKFAKFSAFEYRIFDAINSLPPSIYPLGAAASFCGSIFAVGIAFAVAWLWGRRWLAIQFIYASFIGTVLVTGFKYIVDRPRPYVLFQHVYNPIAESGLGFPSGHTTQATVLAVLVALYFKGVWQAVAVVWVIMVGLSRMYLGVHGPLDIIGGIVLGTIVALATYRSSIFIHKKLVTKP